MKAEAEDNAVEPLLFSGADAEVTVERVLAFFVDCVVRVLCEGDFRVRDERKGHSVLTRRAIVGAYGNSNGGEESGGESLVHFKFDYS